MPNLKRVQQLRDAISELPRVNLAHLPTPLDNAPRLSEALGGVRIFFKRDDLTGLPLSGNKTRMFEFSLAQALEQGADTVVMSSSVQSNYCRQLVFACNKLGKLDVHLVLFKERGEKDLNIQGNLLLDLLAGAKVEIVDVDVHNVYKEQQLVKKKSEELCKQGYRVYGLRESDRDVALEATAYVNCALELYEQLKEKACEPDYLFVTAHDTTHAGLLAGTKYLGMKFQIVGVNPYKDNSVPMITRIANDISKLLKLDISINPDEVINTSKYVGDGHGIVTRKGLEAIKLVARTEGIILDPVYTSKGMAGLIDHITRKEVTTSENVIFLHTGGFPSLFAYAEELSAVLKEKPVIR